MGLSFIFYPITMCDLKFMEYSVLVKEWYIQSMNSAEKAHLTIGK